MDGVNKTLYIPLYGKAQVSKRGIILADPWAEEIWDANAFPLKGKSRSKWLALYMGMRAAVFDRWTVDAAREHPEAVILHLGCGLDSRVLRTGMKNEWYDVDFPDVIAERSKHFPETECYHLLDADLREEGWLCAVPRGGTAIVVMEGISMYLKPEELLELLARLGGHFDRVTLLLDCYTELAARASRYRNPINDVGVTRVYGLDDPAVLTCGTGFRFLREHDMTPEDLIGQLFGMERRIFRKVCAGSMSRKLYRMYELESKETRP